MCNMMTATYPPTFSFVEVSLCNLFRNRIAREGLFLHSLFDSKIVEWVELCRELEFSHAAT